MFKYNFTSWKQLEIQNLHLIQIFINHIKSQIISILTDDDYRYENKVALTKAKKS